MKKLLSHFVLPSLALFCVTSGTSIADDPRMRPETGTLETLILASGEVNVNLDLDRLNGVAAAAPKPTTLRFLAVSGSFFPVLVFNNEFRGPKPGVIPLSTTDAPALPQQLHESLAQLVIEKGAAAGQPYELFVRDGKTGFVFFNIEGHQYDYDGKARSLRITDGRLLISDAFAKNMGRPADAGALVGSISIVAKMRQIEVSKVVNGEAESAVMPAAGTVPGPDVIVGDLTGLAQFNGSFGTQVGLAVGTDSCNQGVENLHWFQNPANDHPVIPQNLYRMSGGTTNTERFEQIGQSQMKHAFTALTNNICNLGCNGVGGSNLGSGCSDPYSASLNSGSSGATLGSRAWVNPFTGAYPRNDSATPNNSHNGHTHQGPTHRILTEINDLNTALNPGATYYAESQYVTPHEYAWCQTHPGQCNMYNNVSYRQYNVIGTSSPFSFSPVSSTQRTKPAILAWTGSTSNRIEPAPGTDGIGFVAYKVTNTSAGVWHYEYAIFNQNLDRAIQSFSVPLGCGTTVSNIGFHAPPQHPGSTADGTVGNAGYSSTPWTANPTATALSWNTQTLAQNPNANAIRWGTTYNFRFDSNRPPQVANATVGFFKTGEPITAEIHAPTPDACAPLQLTSAVSRKIQGGVPYDVDLPLSGAPGIESRRGDVSGNHTIVITFSNNLASGDAAVTNGTGAVNGSPSFSGNTMTVNLTGVPAAQQVALTLTDVTDSFAQTYPETTITMKALFGDIGGNSSVNSTDIAQVKSETSNPVSASNFRADVTADGSINASDVSAVKSMSGTTLPTP